MRFPRGFGRLRHLAAAPGEDYAANSGPVLARCIDVAYRTWDLGFTAFGGPGVQFQIFRRRLVEDNGDKARWVDEHVFQELFSLCQGTPGPASTKLLLCLVWIHAGAIPAIMSFFLWSLPTAIAMLALAIGVQHVNQELPDLAYAFLSGVNSAIVGIIAHAGEQLSRKAIEDPLSRLLVIFAACAGCCYSSLWYYPVLLGIGAVVTILWDLMLKTFVLRCIARRKRSTPPQATVAEPQTQSLDLDLEKGSQSAPVGTGPSQTANEPDDRASISSLTDTTSHAISTTASVGILVAFFAFFITVIVLPRTLAHPARPLELLSNLLLAGTIIFGGGPVLIPLLREYVVAPGWVSARDFLLGLAIIQAFPGPNFNFAVYIGFLALLGTATSPYLGAALGFTAIFLPGLATAVGCMGFWRGARRNKVVHSLLRGLQCAAVGLVFTAVWRIWEIGFLSGADPNGRSLGGDSWWLVLATLAYSGNAWFGVPLPVVIVLGGLLGLCWFAVTHGR